MIAKLHYTQFKDCLNECDLALMRIKASNEFEEAKLADCKMHLDEVHGIVDALYKISGGNENE